MRTRRIFRVVLLTGMMLAVSVNAGAQFGNLGNKLKKKVKEKVEKTTEDVQDKAREKSKQKVANTVAATVGDEAAGMMGLESDSYSGWKSDIGTFPAFDKKFTASAAAKAADPKAADPTVLPGYTKSIGEIHALYENLGDKNVFPFQPYYKPNNDMMYVMDNKDDKRVRNLFEHYSMEILAADLSVATYKMHTTFTLEEKPDGTTVRVYITDISRYAAATRYLCDPRSIAAFKDFAYVVLPFKSVQYISSLNYPMDDVNEGVISKAQKIILPSRDYNKQRDNREQMGITLAVNLLKMKDLCDFVTQEMKEVDKWKTKADKETIAKNKSIYTFLALVTAIEVQQVYERIIKQRSDFDANNSDMRQLGLAVSANNDLVVKLWRAYGNANNAQPAQPFPASKMSNAALLASCVKAARAMYPKEDATAVSIIEGEWMIDRDALGNILRRRVSAWVNIKDPETGKRVARNYGFAQPYQGGGKYGGTIFYGVGTLKGFDIK